MDDQKLHTELLKALNAQGLTLKPINRGKDSLKCEPKWEIVKL